MKKTSIYLEPETDSALTKIAGSRGVSKSKVIRDALRREAKKAPVKSKMDSVGVFDGPTDLSTNTDRYLRESGFGAS